MTPDEARLRELAEAAGSGNWSSGCLHDDDLKCDCPYIFDEGHLGGIASVHISNEMPVSEGGNDAPERKLAQAHQSFIAAANPATILALLDALSAERERADRTLECAEQLSAAISWTDYPFIDNNTGIEEIRSRLGFMQKDAERPRAFLATQKAEGA